MPPLQLGSAGGAQPLNPPPPWLRQGAAGVSDVSARFWPRTGSRRLAPAAGQNTFTVCCIWKLPKAIQKPIQKLAPIVNACLIDFRLKNGVQNPQNPCPRPVQEPSKIRIASRTPKIMILLLFTILEACPQVAKSTHVGIIVGPKIA